MIEKSDKAARLIFLLKKFQAGKSFTTDEIYQLFNNRFGYVSLRTVQRDLKSLQDSEPLLGKIKDEKKNKWKLNRTIEKPNNVFRFRKNELISFHVLKAHLKTFKSTIIEEEINELTKKLEEIAPSEVFLQESLYWDKNIGNFDYTQYDPIIRRAIKYISEKKWVKVNYDTGGLGKIHTYTIMLRCIFNYAGSLYCVGYILNRGDIALAIQHIESVEEALEYQQKIPKFDFEKWAKHRFGVFYGKLRKVRLKINKNYNHYFINRQWHSSQKISYDKQGNLILDMRIPLGKDFIAWVMSWSDAIKVIEPVDLIKEINLRLRNTLKNYE